MRVLVIGGAGYIGSHAVRKLIEEGNDVVVLDWFAFLTLPRLASQLGEAGNGKIDLKIAAINAGIALVAKIICQV